MSHESESRFVTNKLEAPLSGNNINGNIDFIPSCGYEYISGQITPNNIMAAVKIERKDIDPYAKIHALNLNGITRASFELQFRVTEFHKNPIF